VLFLKCVPSIIYQEINMERIFVDLSLLTGYGLNIYLLPVNRMKDRIKTRS